MPIIRPMIRLAQRPHGAGDTNLSDALDEKLQGQMSFGTPVFINLAPGNNFVTPDYQCFGYSQVRASFTGLQPAGSLADVFFCPIDPITGNSFNDGISIPPWGIHIGTIAGAGGAGANSLIDCGLGTANPVGIVSSFVLNIVDNFGAGILGQVTIAAMSPLGGA